MVYFNKGAFNFEEANATVLLGVELLGVELNKIFPWEIKNVILKYDNISATGKL